MKISLSYKDFLIEIFNDSAFTQHNDSPTEYENIYELEEDKEFQSSSQHAITIYDGQSQRSSAILLGSSGATSVDDNTAFIHKDNLIIRCSNAIFSLTLPRLKLNWITKADPITCFGVYEYKQTYITHGELFVCRLDTNGNVIWEFGGEDIFLKLDGENCFFMEEDSIILKDFSGVIYKIDYEGKLLKVKDTNS